jgi:hypothetical protein
MKEKHAQSKPKEGWWKLTPLMEIRTPRGFPPRLEKAAHYAWLFHSSHQPDGDGPSTFDEVNHTVSHTDIIFQEGGH